NRVLAAQEEPYRRRLSTSLHILLTGGDLVPAGGEGHRECAAYPDLALQLNRSPMRLGDQPGNRQPQPGTGDRRVRCLDAVELLVDVRLLLRRNANTAVAHADLHPCPGMARFDRHRAALGRILDGV